MSFLTPFFIAGILAVSLPIVFHLIRRTPSGHLPFSTVMFLEPSPPRISKRRRLDNWLLLLLRGLALILLALAFARPFVRQVLDSNIDRAQGRQIAILIDTSASMQRGNLFQDALSRATDLLKNYEEADEVGLFTFDRDVQTILSFDEWSSIPVDARRKLATERLTDVAPTWAATHLGSALAEVAETFQLADKDKSFAQQFRQKEIVLISDFQLGSRVDALQTYEWPKDVVLTVETVVPSGTTNAGIQFVAGSNDGRDLEKDDRLRVRVTNAADSTREQFQLYWAEKTTNVVVQAGNSKSQNQNQKSGNRPVAEIVNVYVPPGQSRVVRAPAISQTSKAFQLVLTGDDHDFDNVAYRHRRVKDEWTVLYFGSESPDDPKLPRYYIERAFPDTPRRTVRIATPGLNEPLLSPAVSDIHLIVVTESQPDDRIESIRHYAESGGTVVQLLQKSSDGKMLGSLSGNVELSSYEATVENYAMLTDVDITHPILAPFADTRFSDFTKIHIWKHRTVDLDSLPNHRLLARFDNGDPAIIEVPIGQGKLLVFTSGWHPEDSQLALSTKFVPLFNSILEQSVGHFDQPSQFSVGEIVPLMKPISDREPAISVELPDQTEVQLGDDATSFTRTNIPGVYTIVTGETKPTFVVNLDSAESKTSPMSLEKLESFGIQLGSNGLNSTPEEIDQRQRQLHNVELESRQRIWRWLIATALLILVLETWLAGRTAGKGIHARTTESTD